MTTILHFGFPKTGTTYLQQVFRRSAETLQGAGVIYPAVGKDFKARPLKHLTAKRPQPQAGEELDALRSVIDADVAQNPGAHILLSVEEIAATVMSHINATTIGSLRDYLYRWGEEVRLIVYVRRPEDFYLSMMQEKLKRSGGLVAPENFRTDFARIIRTYEEAFNTRAIVRPFEPQQWREGDLLVDFLDQIRDLADVDHTALSSEVKRSNESLSAESMFVLDLLRRFPENMNDVPDYSFAASERFWRALRTISEEAGYTSKPKLFRHVAEAVAAANLYDTEELYNRYGVSFGNQSKSSDDVPPSEGVRLSEVEGLVPLNRDHALRMISVFCARENAYRVKNT
ncbi:hypothetical protein [Paracoccus aestuariivivens]|uniref:Sulfotransferase domain-containing protein n=1 Tax=Paracoccus aestuariivivens TaxID=1820333 RepID=A0A6L6JEL2_9RHOB|nr:hypothetical protein [Paracoccus aestuariivivens]MTH78351.1 hypothetical protein [Paracoccus aestuariivivens]